MSKRIKRRLLRWFIICVILALWLSINNPMKFGLHCYGVTVYSGIPFLAVDVVVRANGVPWFRSTKSQKVNRNELDAMVGPHEASWPDIIIIGTGYDNLVEVDGAFAVATGIGVESYATPQAIQRFNSLKSQGKRVAAIIHSTR